MVADKIPVKALGLVQGAIFVAVITTFLLVRRRAKMLEQDIGPRLSALGRRARPQNTPPSPQSAAAPASDSTAPPSLQVGSALPTWSKTTPPHEILGVSAVANAAAIEAAYKKLLKQYHPDRFASWGKGYQNRAHQIILLLQDARARMLANKTSS